MSFAAYRRKVGCGLGQAVSVHVLRVQPHDESGEGIRVGAELGHHNREGLAGSRIVTGIACLGRRNGRGSLSDRHDLGSSRRQGYDIGIGGRVKHGQATRRSGTLLDGLGRIKFEVTQILGEVRDGPPLEAFTIT